MVSTGTPFEALAPGTVFARDFEIVRPLMQGGMGAVYVAVQRSTGRERALKLMHPRLVEDPALRRRFEQEAQVGARIESAHVVEVVAAGVDDATGMPWLCMELLRGQDLAAAVTARGSLAPGDVLEIFRQLCHALGAAHAVGVVHRDLKPENIFLATSRQAGVPFMVKVLDFGIAKLVAEGLTGDTAPLGTPLWMAPEQTERGAHIGPATDVWALGLIAFKLLTGRCYWRAAAEETTSAWTLLREIAFEPLEPASERAVELGGAALPAGFDGWFARCVVRELDRRFPHATAAFAEFELLLSGAGAPLLRVDRNVESVDASMPTEAFLAGDGSRPAGVALSSGAVVRDAAVRDAAGLASSATAPATPGVGAGRQGESPAERLADEAPAGVRRGWRGRGLGIGVVVASLAAMGLLALRHGASKEGRPQLAPAPSGSGSGSGASVTPEDRIRLAERRAQVDLIYGPMARVPSAQFDLGSDDGDNDEKPKTRVVLSGFEIDLREVSVATYRACVSAGGCTPPATDPLCNWGVDGRVTHPVNCVTALQAEAFCAFIAKRLPTEREWELAARGTDGRTYPWGESAPLTEACFAASKDRASTDSGTCPGGKHTSISPYGLIDMAGNVREWTASSYCPYSRPECGATTRVLRGGSFRDSEAAALRASARTKLAPDRYAPDVGFRCARDALY